MAASKNALLELELGDRNECPVGAGLHLYRGSLAFADAAGRASSALGAIFLGHVAAEADNSAGGEGALNVLLHGGRYRAQVAVPSVALTDIGKEVFASDNNTLSLSAGGGANTLVGRVVRYVTTDTAVVEFTAVVSAAVVTVAQQPVIAATKANYAGSDVTTDGAADPAKIATALNTLAAAHNAVLAADKAAGVIASS